MFQKADVEQSIASRFESMVREAPERAALRSEGRSLTYEALNQQSNRVAHALLEKSNPSSSIALLVQDPIYNVTAQLGVLKAGRSCIPLDVKFPQARQKDLLEDSNASLIITEGKHVARADSLANLGRDVLLIDDLSSRLSTDNPNIASAPDSLAYVLYTSGSTGRSKGVMQSHRGLLQVAMLYSEALAVTPLDRITCPTSLTYTGTLWALLGALTSGAEFVCSSFDSPHVFLRALTSCEVTIAQLIVTLLRQVMYASVTPLDLPHLRMVYAGGEALSKEDVKEFTKVFPLNCGLIYNLGSTEAGIISHLHVDLQNARNDRFQQNSDDRAFPVGPVVKDTEVMLVDEQRRIVPQGEQGEIAVRSAFLSPGYLNDPELTEKHFPKELAGQNGRVFLTGDIGMVRPDGYLLHLGRKDYIVKIRGYRVNLMEIETALSSLNSVAAVAVRAWQDAQGTMQIVAYVERKKSGEMSVTEMRHALSDILPIYMIPSRIMILDRIPVTGSGKVNRNLVPKPDSSRPELNTPLVMPRTPTEEILCSFLSELLNVQPVGVFDNLLDVGADSITIFRFLGRVKDHFNIEMDPRAVFDTPVIEALARLIEVNIQDATHRARSSS